MTESSATPDRLLAALSSGVEVVDLAQPLANGMPCSPNHPGFRMALARRHGDAVRSDGGSSASEIITTGGHVGTHIDALSHVSQDGLLHGGRDSAEAQRGGAFSVHGIDTVEPMVCRATFLDIAALHGTDCLPAGHGITAAELAAAARQAGVEPGAGEVCLINTGWSRWWSDPQAYLGFDTGVPGITPDAARWLVERGIRAAGTDTTAFEQIPAGRGHTIMPVHRIMLVDAGIHIVENMRFDGLAGRAAVEFGFVLAPLRIVGGTGSPVRPLALLSR
ncbi:kynurenine formamidase [Kitasatospora sp. MAA19]|uniref:cyclase family protein n=1 Tax=unclassified Kitasatospora TaxID=2633591 RepID=UPI002476F7B5|nr:cyclase family protein [Kitasatospora sp. MAA19]MDH6707203.1 kynurenine formamidase [Kitasatospora sp. MAA19]